ncbi:TetR/AcrR family transcriptional regulator [Patulibacter sp. S7RM1-6]
MPLTHEELTRIRDAAGGRSLRDLSVEEIARAAGTSRMTLHRRGVGRDDVRAGLAALLESEYRDAAFPALASDAPAPERLRMALHAICGVDERYLGLLLDLGDERDAVFHEDGPREVLTRGPFVEALQRILRDGERDGTLAPGPDVAETATLLFNAVGWTYRHMRTGHRWSPERSRDRLVAILAGGVAA